MYRHNRVGTAVALALLGGVGALTGIVACSGGDSPAAEGSAASDRPSEPVETVSQDLISTPCGISANNLSLSLKNGEVGYVGFQAGCTVEPCVVTNAVDTLGHVCRANSQTAAITVTGTGVAGNAEKLVLDYTNGFFGLASVPADGGAATTLVDVTLDTKGPVLNDAGVQTSAAILSKLTVLAPVGGGNMALGLNGLDVDTAASRSSTRSFVDVKMIWSTAAAPGTFVFQGGPGNDAFTADATGDWTPANLWGTAPSTPWVAGVVASDGGVSSPISATVGGAYTGPVTATGGPGDDVLAGGAGANTLDGNAGFDTFLQSATSHAEVMSGGDDIDTVNYSARSAPVSVSVGFGGVATFAVTSGGSGYVVGDIVSLTGGNGGATLKVTGVSASDAGTPGAITSATVASAGCGLPLALYGTSGGTGSGATITVASVVTADDGVSGESDDVGSDVEIVMGGSAADWLSASPTQTTDVVLMGQAGNDVLVGGHHNDDLCGGAGNDRLLPWTLVGATGHGGGSDYFSGGAGGDTLDYTGSSLAIQVCLSPADTLCYPSSGTPQNGVGLDVATVNDTTVTQVCPRSGNMWVGQVAGAANVAVPTVQAALISAGSAGWPMIDDLENVTGSLTAANVIDCDATGGSRTSPCSAIGGSAADTLQGTTGGDLVYGKGGIDAVSTNGGSDFIDLTPSTGTVTCALAADTDTILYSGSAPTLSTCVAANMTEIQQ